MLSSACMSILNADSILNCHVRPQRHEALFYPNVLRVLPISPSMLQIRVDYGLRPRTVAMVSLLHPPFNTHHFALNMKSHLIL